MKRHIPDELGRIFQSIAGKGLWAPLPQGGTETEVGPRVVVYIKWSEISPSANNLEDRYWECLQRVPSLGALGVFAFINNILVTGGWDMEVHRTLNGRFLSNELKAKVAEYKLEQLPRPTRRAFPIVFNRPGCLMLMRHLILYGANLDENIDTCIEDVGELALLANEFVQRDTLPTSLGDSSSEVPLQFIPIWDIYNPPDLAYALPRMFTTLTGIFPGADNEVRKLTLKLGMNPSSVTSSGIGLVDLISVVFGLYAFGRKVREVGKDALLFENKRVFEKAPTMLPALQEFLRKRSLSLAAFKQLFGAEKSGSREALLKEIEERSFLGSGLNFFRHFPLFKLEDNRTVILDLQFLVDLGTSGVYWSIFDGLPRNLREIFQQLWGRLLELYSTDLLQEFYPPLSGFLKPDVTYQGGQIDALLDFANNVVVFEIKSSLLSEAAKRLGNQAEFEKQVNLKFVRNEKGEPKAVLQLAKSAKSIADGLVPTTTKPARIYPVLVGEEPALQTLGFNSYLNAIFQKEMAQCPLVRPLTVMTIGELEEILPYVSKNIFTWAELFETRFVGSEVIGHSAHQAIFDLRHTKGVASLRNEVILKRFDQIFEKMKESYKFQQ